jgi:hypothetical protein
VRFNLSQPSYVSAIRVYLSSLQLAGTTAQLYDASTRRLVHSVAVGARAAPGWVQANITAPEWLDRGLYIVAMSSTAYTFSDSFNFGTAISGNVKLMGADARRTSAHAGAGADEAVLGPRARARTDSQYASGASPQFPTTQITTRLYWVEPVVVDCIGRPLRPSLLLRCTRSLGSLQARRPKASSGS